MIYMNDYCLRFETQERLLNNFKKLRFNFTGIFMLQGFGLKVVLSIS